MSLLLMVAMGTLEAGTTINPTVEAQAPKESYVQFLEGILEESANYVADDGGWDWDWESHDYNGNPDISEEHRTCPTVLVIGMARKGKSTLCKLLSGGEKYSDEHILRESDAAQPQRAGQRNIRDNHYVAGEPVFQNGNTSGGYLTGTTSVVETRILPEWDPEPPTFAPAPLVLVDTPGISNVTSVMNADEADRFMEDIMRKTLHINNSYGGFERFIIVTRADETGFDLNTVECLKHLAKAFGGGRNDKAREINFLQNVSVVFTFSDRIFQQPTNRERTAAINDVLTRFQQSLYNNSEVAAESGVTLVHNVPPHTLQAHETACYFVDSEQANKWLKNKDIDEEHIDGEVAQSIFDEIDAAKRQQEAVDARVAAAKADPSSVPESGSESLRQLEFIQRNCDYRVKRADKALEYARDQIREDWQAAVRADAKSAKTSQINLQALVTQIRASSKKQLQMQSVVSRGVAAVRAEAEARKKLATAERSVEQANQNMHKLETAHEQAVQRGDREEEQRITLQQQCARQRCEIALAEYKVELENMERASERVAFWKRVGYRSGAVVGGVVGGVVGIGGILTLAPVAIGVGAIGVIGASVCAYNASTTIAHMDDGPMSPRGQLQHKITDATTALRSQAWDPLGPYIGDMNGYRVGETLRPSPSVTSATPSASPLVELSSLPSGGYPDYALRREHHRGYGNQPSTLETQLGPLDEDCTIA